MAEIHIYGTITGTVEPTTSFDKLELRFYDSASAPEDPYLSATVDDGGNFDLMVGSPDSGSLSVKLYIIYPDGDETLIASNNYKPTLPPDIMINFAYNEDDYGYANITVHANGTVTPASTPCTSLDKLIVEFYDDYDSSSPPYTTAAVSASGSFTKIFDAQSRQVLSKLFVVDPYGVKVLVQTDRQYCAANTLVLAFGYDESLYYYGNLNNENMGVKISGLVKASTEQYFNCIDSANLRVRVYKVLFGSLQEITTATVYGTVNVNGTFTYTVPTNVSSFLIRIYLVDDEVEILAAESAKLCHHDDTEITFEIDESKLGRNVFDKITSRLVDVGLTTISTITSLTPGQLSELSCLSCISLKTINRLKTAYELRNELVDYTIADDYPDAKTATITFRNNEILSVTILFGLLRFLSTSLHQAFSFSRSKFNNNLLECIVANEIPSSVLDVEEINLNTLEACRNVLLMNALADGEHYESKLVHLSDNDYSNKNNLLNRVFDGGGLSGINSTDPADNDTYLKKVLKVKTLSTYTANHAPFLKHVINIKGQTLDYWAVAAGTAGANYWSTLLDGFSPLPENTTKEDYAALIKGNIAIAEPSANLYFHLNGSSIPNSTNARTVLNANHDFNINDHSAARFFTIEPGLPNSITEDDMNALTGLQRTLRLTGEADGLTVTTALFTNGTTSSSSIYNTGRAAFVSELGDLLFGNPDAQTIANGIWCKASATNDAVTMAAVYYLRYERDGALMPDAMSSSNGNFPTQDGLPAGYPGNMIPAATELPNMETLFGSFDTCTCSHCQSIYSPAAYLTDLLNWLRKDVVFPNAPTQNGLAALEIDGAVHRRHDIRHIKLHCDNTNVLVPYIDIVNEILSVNLLPGTTGYSASEPTYTTHITPRYKDLQTTKTSKEIEVDPEHRFTASEDLLKNKSFPWVLPYNVAFNESLSVMGISGKNYHEVIKDFSVVTNKHNSSNWAYAYLNINPQEATLLTTDNTAVGVFWLDIWGFGVGVTTPPKLGPVLETTGFSIEEVREILTAYYINGGTQVLIAADEVLCDVESYIFTPVAFSNAIADRFMKFVRLKRKTGLSTWELDMAIKNSGGVINSTFLTKLAANMAFAKEHSISFADSMVLYGINAYHDVFAPSSYSGYYNDKFIGSLLPDSVRSFFSVSGNYAANVHALTNEQKQFVRIVLDTEIKVVDNVIKYLADSGVIGATNTTVAFNSTVLAHIHKYVLLVKIFKIDTNILADYVDLFGNVFTGNIIKAAWNFSSGIKDYNRLGISLGSLIDIMTGAGNYTISKLDLEAEKVWTSVEKAFQEARLANLDKDATNGTYANFYTDVLVNNFAVYIDLSDVDTAAIIALYSGTWLATFIVDPDGTSADREWVVKSAAFAPLHQFLNRIKILTEVFNMSKESMANALQVQSSSLTVLDSAADPFYWLTNSFVDLTAASLKDLLWIYKSSQYAKVLDIPQIDLASPPTNNDFYLLADDYHNNYSSLYVGAATNITALYNKLGENSDYKKLSLFEFTEIFQRAQSLTVISNPGDIVALLDAFKTIYETTEVFKIKATDAWSWVWSGTGWSGTITPTFTPTTLDYAKSADIRRTVNSMYPKFASWSKVIVPVQNDLRARMRDAFVAYYIGYKNGVSENRLYSYFLLDTQMAPCMQTSRIVSAISSVQLLIHRSLLNLEPNVYIDDNDKQEWEWRKNYRVWEANRKVFLYPENWIVPTLRRNKTELFKEAEELLQQDEFSERNAELAFANYLRGLSDVSHLDVRATYVEDPTADLAAGDGMKYKNSFDEILHVFARNWNPPFTYYHRKFANGIWTGWEKMDIEIDSDHLIPAMFNRRLYLFFPIFVDKFYADNKDLKYYEIQMCYTKYDFGKWSQKKLLPSKLEAGERAFQQVNPSIIGLFAKCNPGFNPGDTFNAQSETYSSHGFWSYASMEKSDFYFWSENKDDGSLMLHCRRALDTNKRHTANTYTQFAVDQGIKISASTERSELQSSNEITDVTKKLFLARPYMTMPYYQQMKFGKSVVPPPPKTNAPAILPSDYQLSVKSAISPNDDGVTLLKWADKYTLTYPQQFKHSLSKQPFFFSHPDRSYFFLYNRSIPALVNAGAIGAPAGGA